MRSFVTDESPVPKVPPRVQLAGKALLWFGYVSPLVLYTMVVLFSPVDVLDQARILKRFADAVREWLLGLSPALDIYRHARSTAFPQVAMLASSLGVSLAAFTAVVTALRTLLHFRYIQHLLRLPLNGAKNRLGGLVVLPALGLLCVWATYCIAGDWSRAAGLTTQSRIGYLLISLSAVALAGIGIGTWFAQIRLLWRDALGNDRVESR